MALSEPDPELFTIATLTGHACLGKLNTPLELPVNFLLIAFREKANVLERIVGK
jgi:hypothetical protein